MGKLSEIQALIERGINQFVAICINANRDLPFHDYHVVETPTSTGMYVVGSNNIDGVGDQKKYFVSKSTLFYSDGDMDIHLNSHNNILITLLADTWYEFKSNIHSVFWDGGRNATYFKMYFEGVMYHEARRPE